MAPEVLQGRYDEMCDIWSMGVILYILLSGFPPFQGNSPQEIFEKVASCKYSLEYQEFEVISQEAKDLISQMLTKAHLRLTSL